MLLPEHVPLIADLLRGCDVKTCAVIDFPAGASSTAERARAADRAVAEGADELDVVMNYRAMLAGDFRGGGTTCCGWCGRCAAGPPTTPAATCS